MLRNTVLEEVVWFMYPAALNGTFSIPFFCIKVICTACILLSKYDYLTQIRMRSKSEIEQAVVC